MSRPPGAAVGRPLAPPELFCLDLDDTLIDTEAHTRARLHAAVAAVVAAGGAVGGAVGGPAGGRRLDPAQVAALVGAIAAVDPQVPPGRLAALGAALAAAGVAPGHLAARDGALRAAYYDTLLERLAPDPEVERALGALRAVAPVVVVTNGPVWLQRAKLERSGIDRLVDGVVISDAIGARKPDPAIFRHAIGDRPPQRCLHAGDSLRTDVAGARAAGLRAVWVRPRHPVGGAAPAADAADAADAGGAEAIVDSVAELAARCARGGAPPPAAPDR